MILKNDILELTIDNLGAEITKVKHLGETISHDRDPKYWGRNAPVLFPIVGSLKDSKYIFENQEYNLSQHGFARDSLFEVIYKDDNEVTFLLTSNSSTKLMYPFDFELKITYILVDNAYKVIYDVTNASDIDMYYQLGAHPAFKVKLNENYTIEMANEGIFYNLVGPLVNQAVKYNQVKLNCDIETFKDGALIYEPTGNKEIKLLKDNQDYITITFDDFSLIGIWAPEEKDSPFVCLEPWNGIADFINQPGYDLKDKQHIRKLEPNKTETFSYITKVY